MTSLLIWTIALTWLLTLTWPWFLMLSLSPVLTLTLAPAFTLTTTPNLAVDWPGPQPWPHSWLNLNFVLNINSHPTWISSPPSSLTHSYTHSHFTIFSDLREDQIFSPTLSLFALLAFSLASSLQFLSSWPHYLFCPTVCFLGDIP